MMVLLQALPATSLSAKQSIVSKAILVDDMCGTSGKKAYQYYQVGSLEAVS
jgi:hypothetical protein